MFSSWYHKDKKVTWNQVSQMSYWNIIEQHQHSLISFFLWFHVLFYSMLCLSILSVVQTEYIGLENQGGQLFSDCRLYWHQNVLPLLTLRCSTLLHSVEMYCILYTLSICTVNYCDADRTYPGLKWGFIIIPHSSCNLIFLSSYFGMLVIDLTSMPKVCIVLVTCWNLHFLS